MNPNEIYENNLVIEYKKANGIFYTCDSLTDYIINKCLELYDKENITILDPACGAGNFLLSANKYIDQYKLYGVDIDDNAIKLCRSQLPNANIKCGNSIIGFDWENEFKSILDEGGFDIIIGNPPYIRAGGFTKLKKYLSNNYQAYHGNADIYVYFIERALSLLKPNGLLFFITSNKWLLSQYGYPLRKLLLKHITIIEIYKSLNRRYFPNVNVDLMMFLLCKKSTEDNYEFTVYEDF